MLVLIYTQFWFEENECRRPQRHGEGWIRIIVCVSKYLKYGGGDYGEVQPIRQRTYLPAAFGYG